MGLTFDRRSVIAAGTALAAAPSIAATKPRRSGFLWGSATAAHQIEGGNFNSDYWVLEHIPATTFRDPSGDACDSWHRWREDLALVKAGGMNAYRFSIEWARIEPEPGEFSPAALDHYRRICATAREMGIEPVVTFQHFTSPRWIAARGGWENPDTADRFARYADRAAKALAGAARWICTTNEANGPAVLKAIAREKPWDKLALIQAQAAKAVGSERFSAFYHGDAYRMRDTFLDAHRKGRAAIKSAIPDAKVGMTLDLQDMRAAPGGEDLYRHVWQEARQPFYETARGDDFVGIQTYYIQRVGPDGFLKPEPSAWVDNWGRNADPAALSNVAEEAHRETGVPVLVTENGLQTFDDPLRARHVRETIATLAGRIDKGLPVLGYIHWSLLDNFEWSSGYRPRFGLVEVDRTTFKRTPKPSFAAYRQVIAATRARHRWA